MRHLRPRREYVATLALGAAGAAVVLLCVRQGWARVVTTPPKPLPATSVRLTGQSLVPLAGALAVAGLAGLAAVIATRGLARRLTGLLLAVLGAVLGV
ncbi:MAG TPA: Trp biosynthesis-associated membrane protein, partial [Streptosporangiaceae bacterium]